MSKSYPTVTRNETTDRRDRVLANSLKDIKAKKQSSYSLGRGS